MHRISHPLSSLEPFDVWDHFYRISQIPHPSGGEQAICRYICDIAEKSGLAASMDTAGGTDFGNIIIRCPSTQGYEAGPITVIQSHVDMVALPEGRREMPLDLMLDGTVLRARGTTLGADNGIAAAMALTLMTAQNIVHGPLELLFTINEEAGMTGINALSETALQGRYLINIDSQEEGILNICSAGACHSVFTVPLATEPPPDGFVAVEISITGGKGGHSGLEINAGRANLGQLLARILYEERKTFCFRVSEIAWGEVMNAIPAEARAVVLVDPEKLNLLKHSLLKWQSAFGQEFGGFDGPLQVLSKNCPCFQESVMTAATTGKCLSFLVALPHGVYTMSGDVPGVVETSSSVALVRTSPDALTVTVSQRSLNDASLDAVVTRCETVANLASAKTVHKGKSYGWKPDMKSTLLALCRRAYRQTYGKEPRISGIHGMLECGQVKQKYPDMDIISFGPTIYDAHAPTKADYVPGTDSNTTGERLDTARIPLFWEFFKGVLRMLAEAKE